MQGSAQFNGVELSGSGSGILPFESKMGIGEVSVKSAYTHVCGAVCVCVCVCVCVEGERGNTLQWDMAPSFNFSIISLKTDLPNPNYG